jgi:peroxiredoxin
MITRARARAGGRATLWTLGAVLAGAGILVSACVGPKAVATGEQATDFTLPALANSASPIALSDYAGRPLIISFFGTWSPACAAQVRLLSEFYRHHRGKIAVIGVDARDSRAAALVLLRQANVTFPVAADGDLSVAGKFHVPGVPATYFLDAKHEIIETELGQPTWGTLRRGAHAMARGHLVLHPNND